jgi:hypothetical protein
VRVQDMSVGAPGLSAIKTWDLGFGHKAVVSADFLSAPDLEFWLWVYPMLDRHDSEFRYFANSR